MKSLVRRFARAEEGQALVEFALVMPLVLLFLVGIIEFGRAWNEHLVVTDAARAGARSAVVTDGISADSVKKTMAAVLVANGIDTAGWATIIDPADPTTVPSGAPLRVALQVPYQFTFFGPLIGWTTGASTIPLATSFTMRKE
ncbi:MAG: TadE/TadG family type IV pilus assembly protein [Gemmatimonadales bacterium]